MYSCTVHKKKEAEELARMEVNGRRWQKRQKKRGQNKMVGYATCALLKRLQADNENMYLCDMIDKNMVR